MGYIWLVMAISSVAQPSNDTNSPVLDTSGQALQRGVEYYILPSTNSSGGGLTLNQSQWVVPVVCWSGRPSFLTRLSCYIRTILRARDDYQGSTAWRLGERDPETQRRLIVTGGETGYFRIERNGEGYYLAWCPTDVCPICKFDCGSAGILVENGKRLLALDGPVLSVVFKRA
uniref:Kunitz trypsin inhibitor 2 n=1 Tax=Vitis vinifera TaxID=29760 RepID=A5B632_VITVI|nr:hypothetical protein VITISV_005058 [Vitis vinifera]